MKIKDYIKDEIVLPRLAEYSVLVIYDSENRYHELCCEMNDDVTSFIDASDASISARERAIKALQKVGKPISKHRLLIYVPAEAPKTNESKMGDPFWMYSEFGTHFPSKSGDQFDQICLRTKSDHATEIRKVFSENSKPSFDLIDNIGGGSGWPTLQAVLNVQSTREIVLALLTPQPAQIEKLNSGQTWLPEAKQLLLRNLGLQLQTKQTGWQAVSDELWRFLLFSEFTFDLPEDVALPSALEPVPRAIPESQPFVYEVCDRLRKNFDSQDTYIEKASEIQGVYELPSRCAEITELGDRDTFPFEERSFFVQCVKAIRAGSLDVARAILKRNEGSVWVGRGESQVQWSIIRAIVVLIEKCNDCHSSLANASANLEKLIFYYVHEFFKVDQLHREFEHVVGEFIDLEGDLTPAISCARKAYIELANKVQSIFVKHLEKSGWPQHGVLSNTEIFDKFVSPHLAESGKRVAYFMIDALRYELGAELEKELADDGNTQLHPACAVIPTVTPIGMTSLLPEAQSKLQLGKDGEDLLVRMGDTPVKNVEHRMKWLSDRFGDRFSEVKLEAVIKPQFKESVGANVDLLVIRSSSLDARMETEYQSGLPAIKRDMQAIRVAMTRLREAGFQHAVIATDHGFCINAQPDAGDTCQQPSGTWKTLHSRCLLGSGAADTSNWVLPAEQCGLRAEFDQVGGPRSFACYTAGNGYFHGGASLQEAIVPCLSVALTESVDEEAKLNFKLSYKRGSTHVTTRLPVVELSVTTSDLFAPATCEVLLQALDKQGNVIGEPKPGGKVNPATGTVTLSVGQSPAKIPIRMSASFEGEFAVRMLDPSTLALLADLSLETDYMV